MMIERVCTVCVGNICRSPLAEGLLAARLPGASVCSAGVGALVGEPAEAHAVDVALAAGFDISEHRARQLDAAIAESADLILVMTPGERRWIASRLPQVLGRTFLFGHWQGGADVPDPYRQPRSAFEQTLTLLDSLAGDWVERIG